MFDENQLVEMQWNNGTKKWYESKGYIFTKKDDKFLVKASDLKPTSNKFVTVSCDYCGKEFQKQYFSLKKSRNNSVMDCCYDCRNIKTIETTLEKRAKLSFEKVKEICKERGYELITTIDEYESVFTTITYICPKHGEQTIRIRNLLNGSGCCECRKEKISNLNKLDIECVRSRIEKDGNIWLNQGEYINNSMANLKIKCKCGNEYITSFSSYVYYNVTRCPICSHKESKAETFIKTFLNYYNISFEQEKSFKDCRDIHALPFDFYLPEYNCCIEFNGKQHYEPVEYFGGIKCFLVRQKHDEIKREYCEENNIQLICIPYWEENNIDEILTKKIKFIGKRYSLVS